MLDRSVAHEALLSMNSDEIRILSDELRSFLVQHMAETGGHLASNLGIVELTLAIHKVYNTEKDRLLFDVGHQSYVHKLLTDRLEQFSTLRTFGGLAGFPKPSESIHDAFVAGHASNSISVAVGMARARTLLKQDYDVIAVVGDGALTGGLAYEGLNDAGESGEPLVVVLNDNGMSIKPNVGAVAGYLSRARLKPGYFELKKVYRQVTKKVPGGKWLYRQTHLIKDWLRRKLIGRTIFEEMGFRYLGPVDGHDVDKLTFLLGEAREMGVPVLLHVITQKGRGYTPAETTPANYHGVGRFDPETGLAISGRRETFSAAFGETLCSLAEDNPQICAITAAMEAGTGLSDFADRFPQRFFDVGIAEGHAVTMAAGLAKQGMIPVFAVYSTFLQRGYDMLIHDVSLLGLHVVFAVDRAGLVGEDGETHHGVFDVGFLRQVPGMQVFCPANRAELSRMLRTAVSETSGPVAIRYPRGCDGQYTEDSGKTVLRQGDDLTVVTYGVTINDVLAAADRLKQDGISVQVLKLEKIAPLDLSEVLKSVHSTRRVLVVEECASAGSVGRDILAGVAACGISAACDVLHLGAGIVTHGDIASLRKTAGIDMEGIYSAAKELLRREI